MVILNPSSQSITVTTIDVSVNTTLTLTQDPPGIIPVGSPVSIRINLSRSDTGAGIPGMSILIFEDGKQIPTRTTDSSGNAVQGATSTVASSVSWEMVFEGATVAGLTYNSSRAILRTRVGLLDLSALIVPVIIGGAALVYLGMRR